MKLTDRQRSDLKAIDQIRPVLKRLGLKLRGYGPGISAEGGFHRYIQFDGLEWEWLWPLLKELDKRRRNDRRIKLEKEKTQNG